MDFMITQLLRRFVGFVTLVMTCLATTVESCFAQKEPSHVQEEIERVQNGLLPAAFVKGEPIQRMKLLDRMFVYQVPGVSIAVIHNGAIEWAMGFGVLRASGPSVTKDTLFEAGSVSKPVTALAALLLVQARKIQVETAIQRYLKCLQGPSNNLTDQRKVTL